MKREKQVELLMGPIFPSLVKLAIPIMGTSLLQMAYNLVNMIWLGKLGSNAVAAVGAAGMYLWLSMGFLLLGKIGGQVKVGHALGADNPKEAVAYAKTGFQIAIAMGLIYGLICLVFTKELIGFFRLNGADVIRDAENYLRITGGGVILSFLSMTTIGILMAMGNSASSFRCSMVGLVLNVALDPLFIFGLGPLKPMGVIGAAIATLLSQTVVLILLFRVIRHDKVIFRNIHIFSKFEWVYCKAMLKISFPSAVQNLLFTGISMVIARLIAGWGDVAIAVQKVGSQIESISWMTADGFASALGAFVAQNYGAGNYKRVRKGYITGMMVVTVWGILCTLLLIIFPGPIFRIFIQEEEALQAGIDYLQILGYSQLFMCFEIATSGAFAGLGKTIPPSVEGIAFNALRIPLAIVLSGTVLGLNGIWWSISSTSMLKGVVLFIWFLFVLRKLGNEKKAAKVI